MRMRSQKSRCCHSHVCLRLPSRGLGFGTAGAVLRSPNPCHECVTGSQYKTYKFEPSVNDAG